MASHGGQALCLTLYMLQKNDSEAADCSLPDHSIGLCSEINTHSFKPTVPSMFPLFLLATNVTCQKTFSPPSTSVRTQKMKYLSHGYLPLQRTEFMIQHF